MPKKSKKEIEDVAEKEIETEAQTIDQEEIEEAGGDSMLPELNNFQMLVVSCVGVAIVVMMVLLVNSGSQPAEAAYTATPTSVAATEPVVEQRGDVIDPDGIERKGEGRHFYTTIRVPAGAETLYLSGSGASRNDDGTWGDMEAQTIDTFEGFREKLESEGWAMSDIVQVRAFAVADEFGLLDFDGFNRAYREFFGTDENPMKPVRSFVEIEDLVVDGWLVEIEVRAARMPAS